MQNVDVSFLDEVGKELQQERKREQAYVHTVVVGIGGDDDFVVTQPFYAVFDVECGLQEIELFVLIHDLTGLSVAVEGFSPQAENRLHVGVSAFTDRPGGRVSFGVNMQVSSRRSPLGSL